ncbi:hypothetical protein [Candidatus Villigracilis affinis]|uniref:hypothetical protein n=1 Tax=Candidatus Villigracilis affinis TaxID=3140682 RepID=UPI002A1AD58A|nr:hypothetical protein [Anaerolineales bacterium]
MSSEYELEGLVNEVQSLLATISGASSGSSSKNIRRILTFLAKVIQVVDQAFRDVYTILIEFKYLGMEDIESGRIYKLQKELDILRARDHYRDAEQICSRLHFLNEQFHSDIEPIIFLTKNRKVQNWSGILRLIEEREGSIIMLVNSTIYELQRMFNEKLDRDGLEAIKITAGRKAESIRSSLIQLEALQNKILGLSGEVGFWN